MSFETAILIRPTAPLAGPVPDPAAAARARYTQFLSTQPGVQRFNFEPSADTPAIENPEVSFAARQPPLFVTITWADETSARALFGDCA
jgi:hypothetical protein